MMDPRIEEEEQIAIVDHFTAHLKYSGYSEGQIKEIIVCGLVGRRRKDMAMDLKGKRFMSAVETLRERTRKKLL